MPPPGDPADLPDIFSRPPVLCTKRLVLRQITDEDGEGLFGIFGDDLVTEHYAWERFTSVEQGHELAARTAAQFRHRKAIRSGLVLPGSPRVIGTCGYTRWDTENQFAVLGYASQARTGDGRAGAGRRRRC